MPSNSGHDEKKLFKINKHIQINHNIFMIVFWIQSVNLIEINVFHFQVTLIPANPLKFIALSKYESSTPKLFRF